MKKIAADKNYRLAKRAAAPPSSMNPQHERTDQPGWRGSVRHLEGVEPEVALQHQDTPAGRAELERLKKELKAAQAELEQLRRALNN